MFESGNRTELPLASSAGCSCCTANVFSQPTSSAAELTLEGLTCRHCAQTVEKAVLVLEGVDSVAIELVPGGLSRPPETGGIEARPRANESLHNWPAGSTRTPAGRATPKNTRLGYPLNFLRALLPANL
jgi:copper chaperone CopZ